MIPSAPAAFFDRPLGELVVVLALLATPLVLGGLFYILMRWAQRRNAQLKFERGMPGFSDFPEALARGDARKGARLYFFGDMPEAWERRGRFLAGMTVIAVLRLVAAIAILLIRAKAHI